MKMKNYSGWAEKIVEMLEVSTVTLDLNINRFKTAIKLSSEEKEENRRRAEFIIKPQSEEIDIVLEGEKLVSETDDIIRAKLFREIEDKNLINPKKIQKLRENAGNLFSTMIRLTASLREEPEVQRVEGNVEMESELSN